jgi:hypothetical protein
MKENRKLKGIRELGKKRWRLVCIVGIKQNEN